MESGLYFIIDINKPPAKTKKHCGAYISSIYPWGVQPYVQCFRPDHRHLQRLYLAGSTGKFTLHISDLWYSSQIWLAVKTQHLLASPTPAHHCNTNWGIFVKRLLYLVSLEEAFFGCHCLDVFIGEGYTGRCFSSSLNNQSFSLIMSASFPISQPSFKPIKPQKPFV